MCVSAQVKRSPDNSIAAAVAHDAALELFFECAGSERVDPSWVGRLYHPEVTAQKDNKVRRQHLTTVAAAGAADKRQQHQQQEALLL
jgi:hypothetical protein